MERLVARVDPSRAELVREAARALRAQHPDEPDAQLVGRLAARLAAELGPRGLHASAQTPASVLDVERRLSAHAALHSSTPPEIVDGLPVRWARERVGRSRVVDAWRRWAAKPRGRLFFYVHVPFCRTKCSFCQFESVVGHAPSDVEATLEATLAEARALAEAVGPQRADAITVGGGTPSELSAAQLDALLGAVVGPLATIEQGTYFSVELNPDSTSEAKLRALASHGVSRVSFGVQSMHPPTLKAIARGYQTPAMVDEAISAARRVGDASRLKVAADLIASLPEESEASFRDGVQRLLAQPLDQLVLYAYQPVSRRGRTIDAGALSLSQAAATLLELAEAAGWSRVPHTGSSVIVERPEARRFDVRYVQHAREPTSLLGLGPYAESHVFGQLSYVASGAIDGTHPYLALARTEREELAAYLGRRLAANMPLDDAALVEAFGGTLSQLAPEALGWLLEEGSLETSEGGHTAMGDRAQALRAAWAFLDAPTVGRLRQRASGGLGEERALRAVDDPIVAERAAPLLEVATSVAPWRVGEQVGLRLALPALELDGARCEALLGPLLEAAPLGRLGDHALIGAPAVEIFPTSARAWAPLDDAPPALLQALADGLEVPQPSWWSRAVAIGIESAGLSLEWAIDPKASRLWAAARRGLPPALADALASGSIRYALRTDGEAALRFDVVDEEAVRAALPDALRRSPGRLRTLRVPTRGARPLLEAAEAGFVLASKALVVQGN